MAELRGVWLTRTDSDVLFDEQKGIRALASLAELGFNTIYPAVWSRGEVLFKGADGLVPRWPETGGRDPLALLVERANALGLTVVPWFEYGLMVPSTAALCTAHPDWFTARADGSTSDRHGRVWLNPCHPEVGDFLATLISGIASHYPVAGIQFDDHFGWLVECGYDPFTREHYRQHTGESPPADWHHPDWMAWRGAQLTDLCARMRATLRATRPGLHLSLSPNPAAFAWRHTLQDWPRWHRAGLVDELIVQVYRDTRTAFERELQSPPLSEARTTAAIGILSGLRTRAVPIARIVEQVRCVRAHSFAGFVFFFFESLWNLADEPCEVRRRALQLLMSAHDSSV
jgi:uncharacterized lipoprotein YddW (UPF0748 family)